MRQRRLCPTTEEVADISVFRAEITGGRFDHSTVDVHLKGGVLTVCKQKVVNVSHVCRSLSQPGILLLRSLCASERPLSH